MLGTHRGHPVMYMNPDDMEARGLADDDLSEVWNDLGSIRIHVRRSPGTRPGQVVIYNGYEPFQFAEWLGPENVEPGLHWQPIPIDRAVHVDARKT
jgi:anaerobic selenocysteine-containing dehydrogenase